MVCPVGLLCWDDEELTLLKGSRWMHLAQQGGGRRCEGGTSRSVTCHALFHTMPRKSLDSSLDSG